LTILPSAEDPLCDSVRRFQSRERPSFGSQRGGSTARQWAVRDLRRIPSVVARSTHEPSGDHEDALANTERSPTPKAPARFSHCDDVQKKCLRGRMQERKHRVPHQVPPSFEYNGMSSITRSQNPHIHILTRFVCENVLGARPNCYAMTVKATTSHRTFHAVNSADRGGCSMSRP
jgi:hypothetical protein